ncbi:MAG TPA: hypothetical protein VEA44_16095 [Caulobacter sp.]|nr:hypothetical protein [Caulobacter sp.]
MTQARHPQGGPFFLARSCVEPDEAFATLADLCARLVQLAEGRPTRFRPAAVARGPGRLAGACVAVAVSRGLAFEHVAYAFLPGTLSGDDGVLRRAFNACRARPAAWDARPMVREVALTGGPGLEWAA